MEWIKRKKNQSIFSSLYGFGWWWRWWSDASFVVVVSEISRVHTFEGLHRGLVFVTVCVPLNVDKFAIIESFKLLLKWTLLHWDAGLFYFLRISFSAGPCREVLLWKSLSCSYTRVQLKQYLDYWVSILCTRFVWPVEFQRFKYSKPLI